MRRFEDWVQIFSDLLQARLCELPPYFATKDLLFIVSPITLHLILDSFYESPLSRPYSATDYYTRPCILGIRLYKDLYCSDREIRLVCDIGKCEIPELEGE